MWTSTIKSMIYRKTISAYKKSIQVLKASQTSLMVTWAMKITTAIARAAQRRFLRRTKRLCAGYVCARKKMERHQRMANQTSLFALVSVLDQWAWYTFLAWENGSIARGWFTRARRFNHSFGKHSSVNSVKNPLKIGWGIECFRLWNLTCQIMIMNIWYLNLSKVLQQKSYMFSICATVTVRMHITTKYSIMPTSSEWADLWIPIWKLQISVFLESTLLFVALVTD